MPCRVCPWWLGYLLASPVRRLLQDPRKLLGPYVREGMTVLEPGPGMGFFTLEIARLVGPSGRVVAVDIQPRMLSSLRRRAARAGLLDRIDIRLVTPDTMGLADLAASVDFTPALAVVHELPSAERFFTEVAKASKPGAGLLLAEPAGHIKRAHFESELQAATRAEFVLERLPSIRRSHAAFLRKV
ncbi:MAG: methyltransferase domain-containing protein [Terriglobia bacterium]|jgi:SAM-dependent methyltransferase